jgi:L-rhamnose mutarotase
MNRRFCLALDLRNDPQLIREYEEHHRAVWPEILQSIRDNGILEMEIYRVANRLFMIMEVDEQFSFAAKSPEDQRNPKVEQWEQLMWKYQQALPVANPGEKWMLMQRIFSLKEQHGSPDYVR